MALTIRKDVGRDANEHLVALHPRLDGDSLRAGRTASDGSRWDGEVRPLLAVVPQGVGFLRSRPQPDDVLPVLDLPAHAGAVLPPFRDFHHRRGQVQVDVRSAAYRAHERLCPRLGRRAGGTAPAGADLCAERSVDDVTFGDSDRLLRLDLDTTALSFNLNITALSAVARLSCSLRHGPYLLCSSGDASSLPEDGRG